MTAVIHETT